MTGFQIKTKDISLIRFSYYLNEAPATSSAFNAALPFARAFMHARVSGQEIWIDNAPELDIIQENSSVFMSAAEVSIGPLKPARNRVGKCMGNMYGEGPLLDCSNIFAKVWDEDRELLKALGESIWKQGVQELVFEALG